METLFKRIGTVGWLLLSGNCPSLSVGQPSLAERLLSIVADKPEIVVFTPDKNLKVELREFVDDLSAFFDVESSIVNVSSATDEFMQDAWMRASLMITRSEPVRKKIAFSIIPASARNLIPLSQSRM